MTKKDALLDQLIPRGGDPGPGDDHDSPDPDEPSA